MGVSHGLGLGCCAHRCVSFVYLKLCVLRIILLVAETPESGMACEKQAGPLGLAVTLRKQMAQVNGHSLRRARCL